jgi:hypothetical protein
MRTLLPVWRRCVGHRWLALAAALVALTAAPAVRAADRFAARSGDWDDPQTWGTSCTGGTGAVPVAGDVVHLCAGRHVDVPCGVRPTLGRLVDEAGDWSAGGGFTMDHSACSADQVGVVTFDNASLSVVAIQLDDMQAPAVFVLRGRPIYDGFGETLGIVDFTPAEGCAVPGSCFEMRWPEAGPVPPADVATALQPGAGSYRLVRMESGQHVHDAYIVESTTAPARVRITPGALDDHYGPVSGFTPSLKLARDTAITGWDTANPNRIVGSVASGSVAGEYLHDGRCIVMDRLAEDRSGSYYRIAATLDGGAGADRLGLDPWAVIAAEDAAGGTAWIAPCLRPGDRFSAFEPLALVPAVPGQDAVNFLFDTSVCPTLEHVYLPDASVAQSPADFNHAETLNFKDPPPDCRVNGPVVQIGLRNAGLTPQVLGIWGADGFVFDRLTASGYHRPVPSPGSNVHHGVHVGDSKGVVIDHWSVSWSNNECGWVNNAEPLENRPYEGVEITVRNGNCHDVFGLPAETHIDGGRGFACQDAADSPGTVQCRFEGNLIWAVENAALIMTGKEDGVAQAVARDNVIAYIRPFQLDPAETATGIAMSAASGGGWTRAWAANNVLLGTRRRTGGVFGYNIPGHVAYSWLGEHFVALRWLAAGAESPSVHGILVDAQGPGTTASAALSFYGNGITGSFSARDLFVKRLCNVNQVVYGIRNQAGAPFGASLDWRRFTLGLSCAEYDGVDEGPAGGGSAAFLMGGSPQADSSPAGMLLEDWVIANGDDAAGDPADPNDEWSTYAVHGNSCTSGCAALQNIVCTANRVGAQAVPGCTRNTGAATLSDVRRVGQPGPTVSGARYAGIARYATSFANFGLPVAGLVEKIAPDERPDLSVLPVALARSLAPATLVAAEHADLALVDPVQVTPDWDTGTAAIQANVAYTGSEASGSVRLEYWMFDEPFAGAPAAGQPMAALALGPLDPGESPAISQVASLALPPDGWACPVLVLTEQTPAGRVARDWRAFDCDVLGDPALAAAPDPDGDGWAGALDLCADDFDPAQRDTDSDGLGDVCDPTPNPEPAALLSALAASAALAALAARRA